MENKYYTPNVSEFYPGFEYIYNGFGITNRSWVECVYEPSEHIDRDGDFSLPTSIKDGEVKVKYLDKEDIESLGFKYIMTSYDGYYQKGDTTLGFAYDGTLQIQVRKEGMLDREATGVKIKNKSELKVLLKQLGIDE